MFITLSESFAYSPTQVALAAGVAAGSLVLFSSIKKVLEVYGSPLRNLPSPGRSPSLIWGDIRAFQASHGDVIYQEWMPKFGPTLQLRGFLQVPALCTGDAKAVSYILMHAYDFPKPPDMRNRLSRIFGEGVLLAEGDVHRRQRRTMTPFFTTGHLRELLPSFYDSVEQLKDILLQEAERTSDGTPVDVLMWLNRVTLDIIGTAGFDYRFNSLETGEENELISAFIDVLDPREPPSTLDVIRMSMPLVKKLPNKFARAANNCKQTMDRVGRSLVAEKKQTILAAQEGLDKSAFTGRDLLSVMIKANMATDVKDLARLIDKEVIDQISTMLLAGHETSSSSLSWLFYALAKPENQTVQSKLREELRSVDTARPSMEELNALPYLDAVLKEVLRLDAVVVTTSRCAMRDSVIPVAEPFLDSAGVLRTEIHIGKGERIFIPISAMNRHKRVWGDDADQFKPERWLNPTSHPRSDASPGVFAGLMTFIGGTRACIGYRFALLEMKVIIFVLLRNIQFDLPEDPPKIDRHQVIVTRPVIKQPDGKLKNTMPLRITVV